MSGGGRGGGGGGGGRGGQRGAPGRGTSGRGQNSGLKTEVKTAKGRRGASTRWLRRQLNDPYVAAAKEQGYRSRAAYKLIQLDEKYRILKPGARIVDLGAAPGGWSQVARLRCGAGGHIAAIDISEMEPLPGVTLVIGDFLEEEAQARVKTALGGPADVVLSDMAAPATGHTGTDHLRIMGLAEVAFEFAVEVLAPGGTFIAKVLQGGTEGELLARLKQAFARVRHVKPAASRSDSSEMYLVATGFKGRDGTPDA